VKTAFVTGITGQDGSYLAEFLLEKDYEVHGIRRRSSTVGTDRLENLDRDTRQGRLHLHYGDMTDGTNLGRLMESIRPDEIYNLAAQSDVAVSYRQPEYTGDVNALGVVRLLDAVRDAGIDTKIYQASTSEMFGDAEESPQDESTAFRPRSPYGTSKLYAYWTTQNYRQAYDLFVCNGILFNHESPRRGRNFVTRKISRAVAQISAGRDDPLEIGNLEAERDWGYAPEYVEAMWLMLQQERPDDYVVATGEAHTVREFVTRSFEIIGKDLRWEGKGLDEKGYDRENGHLLVTVNPEFFRPTEVHALVGDASRAEAELGWSPDTDFEELVELMVRADLDRV
jgi:GDPmannose 4,6-dehydratase